jgi:hypothetical protein
MAEQAKNRARRQPRLPKQPVSPVRPPRDHPLARLIFLSVAIAALVIAWWTLGP